MVQEKKIIVVVDDEKHVCDIINEALGEVDNYRIFRFTDPDEARGFIQENSVDLVLTDLVMGDSSGVEIMETARDNHPDVIVILMTGYPTVKTAISVLKRGGYDYLIKPFKLEDLRSTIKRGLEHQRLQRENVNLRSQLELMRVSQAMSGGIRLHHLLGLIVDSAIGETPAEAASIILLDRRAHKYRVRCIAGSQDDPEIREFLHGNGPHGAFRFLKERSYVFKKAVTREGKSFKCSLVIYPLVSRGQNIGFLNVVSTARFHHITAGQEHLISLLASSAAQAVENNYMDRDLRRSYWMTIKALANAIEARDYYTAGHTDRVYRLAKMTARKLGWDSGRITYLRTGCILHDIGKIGVPDAVLNKPGILDAEERKIMQVHPELGASILQSIPFLEQVIPYIISHHERYDGGGYPRGLKGEKIPIEGRLLAVADTFDAIMSDRPYRASSTPEEAIRELIKYRGTQFDPAVVDAFISGYNEGLVNINVIYGRKFKPRLTCIIPPQTVPV